MQHEKDTYGSYIWKRIMLIIIIVYIFYGYKNFKKGFSDGFHNRFQSVGNVLKRKPTENTFDFLREREGTVSIFKLY